MIKVHGSNYEMGYQHGEKCSELIRDHLKICFGNLQQKDMAKEKALLYAKRCIDFAAKYAPHLVEELNGIADGANVSRDEIYYLNTDHPSSYEGCTTFVVFPERTHDSSIIAAQNVDNRASSRTVDRGIILHMVPKKGPEMLAFCRAGNLYPHGINSTGMTRVGNALTSVLDRDFGVCTDLIGRVCLEQEAVEDAVEAVMKARRSKSNTVIMTDRSGRAAIAEWCPDDIALLEPHESIPNRGYFFHTNHFLHPDMLKYEARHDDRLANSVKRLERIKELLQEWDRVGDKLTIGTVERFLSDHANASDSICSHLEPPRKLVSTVACVIAQPMKKTLHVSRGNPCKGEFQTYRLS